MKGGYRSISGTITPENEGKYGLELGSGMGIILGSENDRAGKKHFLNRYLYGFALKNWNKIAMICHLTTFAIFDIFYSLRWRWWLR